MSNKLPLLAGERQPGETDKAAQACNDWLRMGSGRTLTALGEKYRKTPGKTAPTTSDNSIQNWSKRFGWADRAAAYDAGWEDRKNAERRAMLDYGLALDYERVRKLIVLVELLEAQIYAQDEDGNYFNLWLKDAKTIRTFAGNFKQFDLEHFNPALIEQYRRALDDIAKEVGGRIQKTDVTTNGEQLNAPVVFLPAVQDDDGE